MEDKNNMNKLRQTAAGGGKLLSLAALAIIILGCAAPAYADNISIDLDTTAVTLQRSGNLYKHNSSVRVRNSNTYGFTLSMNASQPNLVNDKDSTYKIDSVSGVNQQLAINQWGYGMGKDATTFSSVSSATLADVTSDSKGNCTSVDDCTLHLTFGANLDQKRLPTGSYSTSLTYTVTSKPKPYVPPTPPAPEPPKWTTNGCEMSRFNYDYGKLDGNNCKCQDDSVGYSKKRVKWYSKGWFWSQSYNYSHYSYSVSNWVLATSGSLYGDSLPVSAYIPRFARSGYYIRFCKDSNSSGCTDSDVEPAFKYGKLGVWVSLKNLGCTRHVTDDRLADSSYDAINAAKTLVEAFGFICPRF